MKKCPPGIICIENITLVFIIIAIGMFCMHIWNQPKQYGTPPPQVIIKEESRDYIEGGGSGVYMRPNVAYTNLPGDVLMNPYAPPLRDERYFVSSGIQGTIPINVQTNIGAVPENTSYRQLGILTATNSKGSILPLMGRPVLTNRDKWQYYTMSDSNNQIKLPVSFKSKSCTSEYGCDEISNGDTVYVDGINATFQVTMYDNATMRYLPFV